MSSKLTAFLLVAILSFFTACPEGGGLSGGAGSGLGEGGGLPGGVGTVSDTGSGEAGDTGETVVAAAGGGGTVESPTMPEMIERIRHVVRIIGWSDEHPWTSSDRFFNNLDSGRISTSLIRRATVFYLAGDPATVHRFLEDPGSIDSLDLDPGYYLIFGIKAEFADDDSVQLNRSVVSFDSLRELRNTVEDPVGVFLGDRDVPSLMRIESVEPAAGSGEDNPFRGLHLSEPGSSPKKRVTPRSILLR